MRHALWKGCLLHLRKKICPCQPAQSGETDMSRNFLQYLNFLHVKEQFYHMIQSIVWQNWFYGFIGLGNILVKDNLTKDLMDSMRFEPRTYSSRTLHFIHRATPNLRGKIWQCRLWETLKLSFANTLILNKSETLSLGRTSLICRLQMYSIIECPKKLVPPDKSYTK